MTISSDKTTGVLAAIFAPLFMTIGFIVWDIEWKKAGGSAFALNMFKCNLASVAFIVTCIIFGFENESKVSDNDTKEDPYIVFTIRNVGFLMLSSFIGIVLGDSAWLEALRLLGATRVLVVDSIKPFLAALLGRLLLDEKLNPLIFVGMILTIFGILFVSLEKDNADREATGSENDVDLKSPNEKSGKKGSGRREKENNIMDTFEVENGKRFSLKQNGTATLPKSEMGRGYVLSFTNVLMDTFGSFLTKKFGVGMTTWAVNLIRFGFAGIFLLLISSVMRIRVRLLVKSRTKQNEDNRQPGNTLNTTSIDAVEKGNNDDRSPDRISHKVTDGPPWYELPDIKLRNWTRVSVGVAFVTFICPALSNYALFQIVLALAITLGSITPLYALVFEWLLQKKAPTFRAVGGALMAVAGVIILGVWRV